MEQRVDLYKAELLAMTAGRVGENAVLIFTMRPESRSFRSYNFAFSHAQAVRIYREVGQLLSDPDSWLHVPDEERQKAEGADL